MSERSLRRRYVCIAALHYFPVGVKHRYTRPQIDSRR